MFFKGVDAVIGAVTVTAGEITAIAVTTKGSGYNTTPEITITDSSGTGALATGVHGRAVDSVTLVEVGSYTFGNAPNLSFTNATGDTTGSGEAGNAVL